MVNSLRVINQQQNSSFVYWKQSWDRVSIRRAVGLGVEIPVCEEPLEKEKKGKADFLECRPKQHRVPQKAELDTRCVCRKFSSGTCISRNVKRRWVIKLNTVAIGDQSSRGRSESCAEYTSKLATRKTNKRNYASTFFCHWSRVAPGGVHEHVFPGLYMLQNSWMVSRRHLNRQQKRSSRLKSKM